MATLNNYERIIERVFAERFHRGDSEILFDRDDIIRVAQELGIGRPKNVGDVVYAFRYRQPLPKSVRARAPRGREWVIRPAGPSQYKFCAVRMAWVSPAAKYAETKVPDSTPGVISRYALSDEQALLAKLRYNRLIDIFTGVTCYSLQNHLRTAVRSLGQVETDELYVGIDKRGAQYVIPVQAKGGRDSISIVQIEQDMAVCKEKFPDLICRPVGAQFMRSDLIALFEFEDSGDELRVSSEKHYRLVSPKGLTARDLQAYRLRQE